MVSSLCFLYTRSLRIFPQRSRCVPSSSIWHRKPNPCICIGMWWQIGRFLIVKSPETSLVGELAASVNAQLLREMVMVQPVRKYDSLTSCDGVSSVE